MTNASIELLQPSDQSLHARHHSGIDQCAADYRNRAKSKVSSKATTGDFPREINDLTKSN
jgi:hypothetical protein